MERTTARDRNGLVVLGYEECLELLGEQVIGRIGFVDAGSPVIVPVNYVLDGATVVFRSPAGAKLDTADRGRPLALEIDGHDADTRTGWSVLVTGTTEPIDDADEVARFDRELDAWALGDRADVELVRIRPDRVTGRLLDAPAPVRAP
jgi:uncharacterized protein